ncbi:MAG: CopG family transcriptional regulator [Deltaproteobacteria bacterium]|nr:CopG family transcriptional regulator [Deltaproteobacteria bacterium]
MVRTQIQLTDDQARMVKKLAAARGVSMAEFIRQAIEGLIQASPVMDREERVKRAREIVGKFSSGKSDISRKHDAYLSVAYKP